MLFGLGEGRTAREKRAPIGGCGDSARRFLDDGGRGVVRERSDPMTTLKVGIASYDEMKARTMAVARGE
jgi:hypothetical protein